MRSSKPPTVESQKKLVDSINSMYFIGDKIKVKQDDGAIVEWTMQHSATMLGGHTAVIWCEEHPSCYSADRVIF